MKPTESHLGLRTKWIGQILERIEMNNVKQIIKKDFIKGGRCLFMQPPRS